MSRGRKFAIVIGVIFAVGMVRQALMTPEERAAEQAARDKAAADRRGGAAVLTPERWHEQLGKIARGLGPMPTADQACPDDEIGKHRLGFKLDLKTISAARLVRLVDGAPPPEKDPNHSGPGDPVEMWSWLDTAPALEKIVDAPNAEYLARQQELFGPYVAIYRPESATWPRLHKKEGVFTDDYSFDGGQWRGWLVIYDYEQAKAICHAQVIARSSDKATYNKHGFTNTTPEKALRSDLEDNFKRAADKALAGITKHMSF